jgi:hypothetical protein
MIEIYACKSSSLLMVYVLIGLLYFFHYKILVFIHNINKYGFGTRTLTFYRCFAYCIIYLFQEVPVV